MKLIFPSSYEGEKEPLGFKVGDILTFKDSFREPMTITEIHIKTKEEEAEESRRAEMNARALLFDHTCPECGHQWDEDE